MGYEAFPGGWNHRRTEIIGSGKCHDGKTEDNSLARAQLIGLSHHTTEGRSADGAEREKSRGQECLR
jgi:hypothetical protein